MTRSSQHLLDSLDIIFLGTIGLGTIAWFARHQIADKLFKSSKPEIKPAADTKTGPPKKERNFVKVMQQQGRRVIFFYGSQTGTAEDYASRLAKECSQKYGVSSMAADIEQYDMSYLDTVPEDFLVFFVMATYGEGEPTDNAVDFWDLVSDEQPQFSEAEDEEAPLKNLRYVAFGLGNKTYEHYNEVIRNIDKRLTCMGAKRIGERGEGDDDGSLEEDFLAWQEEMWPAFCEALGVDENSASSGPRQASFAVEELSEFDKAKIYVGELSEWLKEGARVVYDAKRPYNAPITSTDLFKGGDRHCLHMEIDISDSNLTYQTGDHVAIWPTNNEIEIERLAKVLGLSDKLDTVIRVQALDAAASKQFPFPVPTTYRAIFRHYLDICAAVSRQTLMSLIEYAPTEKSKDILRKLATDKDEYRVRVGDVTRNLGEVLEMLAESESLDVEGSFSSVPFDLIVESVSRLQPRYYSISSSSKESPKKITVTVVTLQYTPETTSPRTVYGVNTNYLWRLHESINGIEPDASFPHYSITGPRNCLYDAESKVARVPVHVRRSQFKLPRNPTVPVIMVGPGTGVAPFRGFVREQQYQYSKRMSNHLSYLRNVKTVPSPSGWTPETKYIDKLFWSPNVPAELKDLYQPANPKVDDPRRTVNFMNEHVNLIGTFPGTKEQKRNVKIKKITDKDHPCCGAYGLIAAQTLQPKQLIIDYLGVVEYQDGYEATSDYVLRYGTDLSIDAGRCGNEARFCNDFRGCGPEPNVCFMNYMDEKTKHIKVGIFVNGNRKIRKGDELLVTYGKSFWAKRGIDMSGQQHKK